ncbi:hypothetical protein VNI00_014520 [Paramarasmius palmivorus]|uniref:Uncharacterized protein n=1 Tax=Paramarasmius palmivorus TaxID=297713 RepID=A0AAW0BS08_9AGAR
MPSSRPSCIEHTEPAVTPRCKASRNPRALEHSEPPALSRPQASCAPSRTPKPTRRSSPYPSSPRGSFNARSRHVRFLGSDSESESDSAPTPKTSFQPTRSAQATTGGSSSSSDEDEVASVPLLMPGVYPDDDATRGEVESTDSTQQDSTTPQADSDNMSDSEYIAEVKDDSESDGEEDPFKPKIRKPDGEAGRPNGKGYNLRKASKLPNETLEQLHSFVKKQVLKKMDCSLPFSEQPLHLKREIRREALQKFSVLDDYHQQWPVDDLIRSHLKYQKTVLKKKGNDRLIALADAESKRRASEIFIETLSRLREAHAHTQAEALQAQLLVVEKMQGMDPNEEGRHPKRRRKMSKRT